MRSSSHRSSMSRSHRSSMSSHRSSMSRSHHSSMSSHRSSLSRHRSSLNSNRNGFGGIRHNSMHRSSFSKRSGLNRHRSSFSHSPMNMHRSSLSRMRRNNRSSLSKMRIHTPFKHHGISDAHAFAVGKATGVNINASAMGAHGAALHRMSKRYKFNKSKNNFSGLNSFKRRKIKFTHNQNYKSKKYKLDPIKNNLDINIPFNNSSKFIGIFFIAFMIIFIIMMISMATSFSSRMSIFR